MSAITMRSRIEAGAQLLDRRRPGWDRDIDPAALNIEFETTCALAHTDGTYTHGRRRLFGIGGGAHVRAADHGFFSSEVLAGKDTDHPDARMEYAELTKGWLELIAERRAAVQESPEVAMPIAA